jgi:hypothetical protein
MGPNPIALSRLIIAEQRAHHRRTTDILQIVIRRRGLGDGDVAITAAPGWAWATDWLQPN